MTSIPSFRILLFFDYYQPPVGLLMTPCNDRERTEQTKEIYQFMTFVYFVHVTKQLCAYTRKRHNSKQTQTSSRSATFDSLLPTNLVHYVCLDQLVDHIDQLDIGSGSHHRHSQEGNAPMLVVVASQGKTIPGIDSDRSASQPRILHPLLPDLLHLILT